MKNLLRNIFTHKKHRSFIHADEVFMDSQNIPGFNINQMQGVIERSIPLQTFHVVRYIVCIVGIIFIVRLFYLQILQGDSYRTRAENNRLDSIPVFAERGVIYDRNLTPLAWNQQSGDGGFLMRKYISNGGFSHVVGYVRYPERDSSGNLWRSETVGEAGIEKALNTDLAGVNGKQYLERDVSGTVTSENLGEPAQQGENIVLSIDERVQSELYKAISEQATSLGFVGGAGAIMDIHTGELIALTSFPEYNNEVMSEGTDKKAIYDYKMSPRKPFINRAVSGMYTPGSIVKTFIGIAGLEEGIITPQTTVYSSGKITVPNKYDPSKPQIFRDWKPGGHGTVNIYTAIAESVNTYFYAIGGGYGSQTGLGIDRINQYMEKFGLDEKIPFILPGIKTGTVPSIDWKKQKFKDGTWRVGDTYNTSIGQFGFQLGVLPVLRGVASIANNGTLVDPVLIKNAQSKTRTVAGVDTVHYSVMREAMRTTVTRGTGQAMNVPFVSVAAKSGTAQVGPNRRYMNSWITGFFPYDKPEYAFVVVLEQGPSTNQTGASHIMAKLFYALREKAPEYVGGEKIVDEKTVRIPAVSPKSPEELTTTIDTLDQFYESYNILEEEPEKNTQKKQKPEEPTISEAADVLLDGTAPLESTDNQSL